MLESIAVSQTVGREKPWMSLGYGGNPQPTSTQEEYGNSTQKGSARTQTGDLPAMTLPLIWNITQLHV